MLLYSLVVIWFVNYGHRQYRPAVRPWYRQKVQPTFTDMLATLRRATLREQIIRLGLTGPGSQKIIQIIENTLALAA